MFPAYIENPPDCRFESQDSDESILLLLRAHPITNLSWVILAAIIFFIPFIVPYLIPILRVDLSFIPQQFLPVLILINYLLVLVIVFEGFLGWYFNVYILTDKRIYDFDFHSLLSKNVDLAPLNQIQEASGSTAGILGVIFHFGNVFVQTAGASIALDFPNVPFPEKVADMIMDQAEKHGGKKHAP